MVVMRARVVDATHLELAKPIDANQGELITLCIAESGDVDNERQEWLAFSSESLANAYGDIEPEYAAEMVRERNPEYKG